MTPRTSPAYKAPVDALARPVGGTTDVCRVVAPPSRETHTPRSPANTTCRRSAGSTYSPLVRSAGKPGSRVHVVPRFVLAKTPPPGPQSEQPAFSPVPAKSVPSAATTTRPSASDGSASPIGTHWFPARRQTPPFAAPTKTVPSFSNAIDSIRPLAFPPLDSMTAGPMFRHAGPVAGGCGAGVGVAVGVTTGGLDGDAHAASASTAIHVAMRRISAHPRLRL